jgi:hypothetical protein
VKDRKVELLLLVLAGLRVHEPACIRRAVGGMVAPSLQPVAAISL